MLFLVSDVTCCVQVKKEKPIFTGATAQITCHLLFVCYRITDFGTSRVVLQETQGKLTKGLGTPQYMAPEILSGTQGSFKKPSDVYSYAISIYELWTEKSVYEMCKLNSYFEYVGFVLSGSVNVETHIHTRSTSHIKLVIFFYCS